MYRYESTQVNKYFRFRAPGVFRSTSRRVLKPGRLKKRVVASRTKAAAMGKNESALVPRSCPSAWGGGWWFAIGFQRLCLTILEGFLMFSWPMKHGRSAYFSTKITNKKQDCAKQGRPRCPLLFWCAEDQNSSKLIICAFGNVEFFEHLRTWSTYRLEIPRILRYLYLGKEYVPPIGLHAFPISYPGCKSSHRSYQINRFKNIQQIHRSIFE